ncbi:hypothetical protein [Roseateles chitinivorans]|uniref:hypothetical protein n=1 Tax=Roseateles chitinivorans TaxID=2917965 RepID=UPI003D6642BE
MSQKAKAIVAHPCAACALTIFAALFSAGAEAKYIYNYVCPRFAGGLFMGEGAISLQLFDEHPGIGRISGRRHVVLDRFEYSECQEDRFFCISGDESKFLLDVPIAAPKIIYTEYKYEYSGLTLEATPVERERYKNRRAVQLLVQRSGDQGGSWYSLTIVEGVGVVDFYIPRARATRASTGDPIEVKDLTCYLDSNKGIFSKVVIQVK